MERRKFLALLGAELAGTCSPRLFPAIRSDSRIEKLVLVGFGGGTRFAESFGPQGQRNIPFLRGELFPAGTFFSRVYNDGETTHYPATAAVLTGRWQNVAQYGGERPHHPTIFEYFRKQLRRPPNDAWFVAQGKGFLSAGYSTDTAYGAAHGAQVVAPRQMMLGAFRELLRADAEEAFRDRKRVARELERSLRSTYLESEVTEPPLQAEGGEAAPVRQPESPRRFVPETERFLAETVARFLAEAENPRSSDALSCFVARAVMERFEPSLLVVNFGEIDVAHQGSFSLYAKAIRNADRQVGLLWEEIQKLPAYRGHTALIVVPDHGRNLDGMGMNGFQHHRGGDDG
jgi:hypothetical protein